MQISKEIIEVLDYLGSKVGLTIDWTSENVLPYIQQLCGKFISWEIATSIAWIVISVLAIIVVAILEKLFDGDGFFIVPVVIAAVLIICFQTFDIVECKTFPEKTIFEYIDYNTDLFD